jgi:hypothetical protein
MTILEPPPVRPPVDESAPPPVDPAAPPTPPAATTTAATTAPVAAAPLPPGRVALAALLACAAAAWPVAHIFSEFPLALCLCLLGSVIGIGCGYRAATRGPSWLGYAPLPVAALAGLAVVAPFAHAGVANLAQLVRSALDQGGLAQPPVPFLPGWRFLVLLFFAALAGIGLPIALALRRPKIAVLAAAPVALAASLLQPQGGEVVGSAVAAALLIAAQTVAGGAELAARGVTQGTFERRRLLRGGGMLVATTVALVLVSQTSFLFPSTKNDTVVPPRKPPTPPPLPDRELFRTDNPKPIEWRVGVLDVYADNAMLLPPYDPHGFTHPQDGTVAIPAAPAGPRTVVHVTMGQLPGATLPVPPRTVEVADAPGAEIDRRTGVVRLAQGRLPLGLRYAVSLAPSPTTKQLQASPPAPADIQSTYLSMPPPSPGVSKLLAKAPATPLFDRLQYVRQALYSHVVAAGAGKPKDVAPADVDSMLNGGEASPYQIIEAEVMLARWAGAPARMGFGFSNGTALPGNAGRSYRPRDGAAWLEAYFGHEGWVPLIGVPPKAKASLSPDRKKNDQRITASKDLALMIYVPVRGSSFRATFELVRFYVLISLPILAGLVASYLSIPYLCKRWRRRRRRAWARSHGPSGRVLVAYAESGIGCTTSTSATRTRAHSSSCSTSTRTTSTPSSPGSTTVGSTATFAPSWPRRTPSQPNGCRLRWRHVSAGCRPPSTGRSPGWLGPRCEIRSRTSCPTPGGRRGPTARRGSAADGTCRDRGCGSDCGPDWAGSPPPRPPSCSSSASCLARSVAARRQPRGLIRRARRPAAPCRPPSTG